MEEIEEQSLMMENVTLKGYIYENYNAITGNVKDPAEGRRMGDDYYHWIALLGFIELMEKREILFRSFKITFRPPQS